MLYFIRYKYNLFFMLIMLFFCAQIIAKDFTARDYVIQAQKLIEEFKYFEATSVLQKALKINPYYSEAQILLGDAYFAMENYHSAWEIYLNVEQKLPNDTTVLLKLAKTKLKLAQTRTDILATEFYLKKAYKLQPRNSEIYLLYGQFYMKLNDYEKALEYYNSLGDVYNSYIYIDKAKIYQSRGQDNLALEELKKAETIDSRNYHVLLELGKAYSRLGEYNKAMTYLDSAYSYNNTDRDILQSLADLYIKEKNYIEASQKINELILQDTTNTSLYYNLALCYEALGDFKKTIEILQRGLEYDYGNEFLRIKAEEIAVNKIDLTDPIRKNLAAFYINHARFLLNNNQQNLALLFLKRALRLDPLNIQLRMEVASIYRKKSFLYEYLTLLNTGLFLDSSATDLKDQVLLNQKFVFNSLEYKEQLNPNPIIELEPIIKIKDAIIDNDLYYYFEEDAKELLLEALSNNHSLNVFIESQNPMRKSQFDIRFTLKPSSDKLEINLELIYISSGDIYKSYNITEYGNNRLIHGLYRISEYLEKDIPKIARILKVNGNHAIINIGSQQGIKLGQEFKILNNTDLPNKYFTLKTLDPSWEIASAKVIELGENISKISFKPLDHIIFNMVQQNQSMIITTS